jgi:hypothetical protein
MPDFLRTNRTEQWGFDTRFRKQQKDSRSPRRYRELLCLEICEAFGVRLSFLALCFVVASPVGTRSSSKHGSRLGKLPNALRNRKRQKDSRSPRRWRELVCLEICEAFGVRLSFLALCFVAASPVGTRSSSKHDSRLGKLPNAQLNQKRQKDSRSPRRWRELVCLKICEAFGVRLSFWRFVSLSHHQWAPGPARSTIAGLVNLLMPCAIESGRGTAAVQDAIASCCDPKSAKPAITICTSNQAFCPYLLA